LRSSSRYAGIVLVVMPQCGRTSSLQTVQFWPLDEIHGRHKKMAASEFGSQWVYALVRTTRGRLRVTDQEASRRQGGASLLTLYVRNTIPRSS
jgi:hypothetical protein